MARVHTNTHTQLHLFIKEYCTVLHGYCKSRLEIEICGCTIISATEHDCLSMTQCKRIAGIFGANGGRNASATLRLFSPLIFSFLPLPSSATQNWRLPGSARSNTSYRVRSVAVPLVREAAGPWFGTKLCRGYNSPSCKIGTCRNIPNPYQIRLFFFFFFSPIFNTNSIPVFSFFLFWQNFYTCETLRLVH